MKTKTLTLIAAAMLGLSSASALAGPQVGTSPWGPDDEIGRLNLMTPASQAGVLSGWRAARPMTYP